MLIFIWGKSKSLSSLTCYDNDYQKNSKYIYLVKEMIKSKNVILVSVTVLIQGGFHENISLTLLSNCTERISFKRVYS